MESAAEKIKIIIFIDWFEPAFKAGGPIRSIVNLVNHLKKEFDFYIITGDRDLGDEEPFHEIVLNNWINNDGYKVIYLSSSNQNKDYYHLLIDAINPQIIYLNSLFSYKFTLLPLRQFKKSGIKIILASRGMLGPESLKIKKYKKELFLLISKVFKIYKKIHWHASSAIELNEIKKAFGNQVLAYVIPNLPVKNEFRAITNFKTKENILSLLVVCRISPIKNLSFLFEVLNLIDFDLELNLIGPVEDEIYWDKCKIMIKKLPENCKVNYLGELSPKEIRDEISQHHLLISTSLNENYGHSIVEALSMGCPVLISNQTPWKGLKDYNAGEELDLDLYMFSDKLKEFSRFSNEKWTIYREGAINYFNKKIDLNIFREKYIELFNSNRQENS